MYHLLAYSKHVQHYQQLSIDCYTGNPKLYSLSVIYIYPSYPTVPSEGREMSQSVPLYPKSHYPWDGLDSLGTSPSVPCSIPYSYCPSHPIVPWDGLDRLGISQSFPCSMPNPYCISTVPWGGLDRMGMCQSVPCSMPYSMEKHEMEMEMERKRKREVQRLHDLPTQTNIQSTVHRGHMHELSTQL